MELYNCLLCKLLNEDEDGEFICPAFPKGIPQKKLKDSNIDSRNIPCKKKIKWIKK